MIRLEKVKDKIAPNPECISGKIAGQLEAALF